MIKQAHTIHDLKDTIELLQTFLCDTAYTQALEASQDLEHLGRLAYGILSKGYIWLAYVEDKPVGLLMAIKEPNMWISSRHQLREIVWYVRPEHRMSSIGGRLFAKYCAQGERMLDQGLIDGYFTTRMTTTDGIDYARRGFRLTEQTYLKER
jgi:hypothetical protein